MYVNSKVRELRDIAKSLGLRGWSKLRKANLISFITNNEKQQREVKHQQLEKHEAKREDQANRRKARQEKNEIKKSLAKAIKE